MRTKPFLPALAIAALLSCITLFYQCKHGGANADGVNSFLNKFNFQVENGQTKDLLGDFDMPKKKQAIMRLLKLLCNQTGASLQSRPIFKVSLDIDGNKQEVVNTEETKVTIPLKFHRDSVEEGASTIVLNIKRVANSTYKIVDVDADKFLKDHADYENLVRMKTLKDADIYSPQTLAAFKVAETLKASYDSVVWFTHLKDKTYYYVVKGKLEPGFGMVPGKLPTDQKMGLVGPDLKEIIPAEYSLIHNLNGTVNGLIEVEKGSKRGFCNLTGKAIVPAEYDQIFPIADNDNLAVLRKDDDYYYLKKDTTVSEKTDLKVADFIYKIKKLSGNYKQTREDTEGITEHNSRTEHGTVYICPSYLVDLDMVPRPIIDFSNPLRRNVEVYEISTSVETKYLDTQKDTQNNWLQTIFYNIRDYFVGGRADFYEQKHVVVADNKRNRLMGAGVSIDRTPDGSQALNGACNELSIRPINDSIYEAKMSGLFYIQLYDGTTLDHAPCYTYLAVRDGKLVEIYTKRDFSFTKFVKMDDSYLNGCYQLDSKTAFSQANTEMLRYMKNEIYADYQYKFKDKKWQEAFAEIIGEKTNDNVNDSLTVIDKYNINFIDQKLKAMGTKRVAMR